LEELAASIFGLVQEKLCWTIMKMEAVSSSKISVTSYQPVHCYIPEECNLKVRYSNEYKGAKVLAISNVGELTFCRKFNVLECMSITELCVGIKLFGCG